MIIKWYNLIILDTFDIELNLSKTEYICNI